jgi:hypothetical protein
MTRADDRRASAQAVRCERCGASVLAAKFSPEHTSVQWTAAAAATCAEFTSVAGVNVGAPVEGCGALRDSIDAAVASGRLAVCPPSYE